MAAFSGHIEAGGILSAVPTNPDLGSKDIVADVELWKPALCAFGSLTSTQPVDEPQDAQTGVYAHAFGFLDWYNRIHIQYSLLDMGNLLSTQVVEFEIFSTYFEDRTLVSTSESGTDGLVLGLPIPVPIPFAAWQSRDFTLTISTDGPPTIEANYVFNFDTRSYSLDVIGRRVVSWFVPPNWQTPIVERIEFSTSVIRAYDGSEQRAANRGTSARWFWDFAFNASDRTQRILENVLYQWNSRVWALPIWPQGVALTAGASAGDATINCPTTDLDFHAGGLAVLTTLATPEIYEAIEILSLDATTITAKRGLTGTWPEGTLVFPVRTARLTQSPALQRFTGGHVYGRVAFKCEEPLRRTPATETLYRSFPVLTVKPDWAGDPGVDYQRKVEEIDFGISAAMLVEDQSGLSEPVTSYRRFFTSRAESEDFREWLFARRGRLKAIWVPSFAQDLIVKTAIGAAGVNLDVEVAGLKNYVDAGIHRRDLRIEMKDGTIYYRRASAYVEVDGTTERITLDSALGVLRNPEDFALVSWMALVRLDADSIEIAHYTGEAAASSTVFRGFRNSA